MPTPKKKFKDTRMGVFLRDKAPNILQLVGDFVPDGGLISTVSNLVKNDNGMSEVTKLEFERLRLEAEVDAQRQVTARWEADMRSKSWLSSNIRPMVLIAVTCAVLLFAALDASEAQGFAMPTEWINLLTTISTTVFAAYFAGRSWEKIKTP